MQRFNRKDMKVTKGNFLKYADKRRKIGIRIQSTPIRVGDVSCH